MLDCRMQTKEEIWNLVKDLYPLNRSLTGMGVQKSLEIIKGIIPDLKIRKVPSGTNCYDWEVPQEWEISDAFIIDPNGNRILDFSENNLHVVGYSVPIDKIVNKDELEHHLYSLPEFPDAIPYVTSYYEKHWGFCIQHRKRINLPEGRYRVKIDSSFSNGYLIFGELLITGNTEKEIFLSTNICHPNMGNNEISGPAVTAFIGKHLSNLERSNFSYRIIFIPETIGSICYLSRNLEKLQKRVVAGFVVTCVGDNNRFSFLPSRNGNTTIDKISRHVLNHWKIGFKEYSWLDRGSDERQYCWPGIDLPIVSIMRSKYHEYPEYHTSEDNLEFISPDGLFGSYEVLLRIIDCVQNNFIPKIKTLCEPHLHKRALYSPIGTREKYRRSDLILNFLSYCDGKHSLVDIANKIDVPMWELTDVVDVLIRNDFIESSFD